MTASPADPPTERQSSPANASHPLSSDPLHEWGVRARTVHELSQALRELAPLLQELPVPPLSSQEWYAQLEQKLVPQLGRASFLVVAVVGGTNIGKSVVFNHLAGANISAITPIASGTKHPVCLVPEGFTNRMSMSEVFPQFEIRPWHDAEEALELDDVHRLYWTVAPSLPPNLLILDTPDIDSDAIVNWERADRIRHSADLLIAVLTQQKYNDAVIKEFFRKAREESKAIIVIFNRCQLPDDETYWPRWLQTFCESSGISPLSVYIAPHNRSAAESLSLPFYRRHWPQSATTSPTPEESTPVSVQQELAQLHFDAIKRDTLIGAWRQLVDPQTGLPSFLEGVQRTSRQFSALTTRLNAQRIAEIPDWPSLPGQLLVDAIREWWRSQREGWTRGVHDFYNTIGQQISKPIGWAWRRWAGPAPNLKEAYLQAERDAFMRAIDRLYHSLSELQREDSSLIAPRIQHILSGDARQAFLQQLHTSLASFDLDSEISQVVASQLQEFRQDSPQLFHFLRQLDTIAAAARPVTSAVLFFLGGVPGVDTLMHETATQAVLHVASGTGTVLVGEAALTGTSSGLRLLEARFRQLESAVTARRVQWFAEQLQTHLLGSLRDDLNRVCNIPDTPQFQRVLHVQHELMAHS